MKLSRILHIEDDSDIRDVVELSLGRDPTLAVTSCASGASGLVVAEHWLPDLILCDVMMPEMDGPATLLGLREKPITARIPVVFMTARLQAGDLDHWSAMGVVGVIGKPFDPIKLPELVRGYLDPLEAAPTLVPDFAQRLRVDSAMLSGLRDKLAGGFDANVLRDIQFCAHQLAGAAGVFDLPAVSRAAAEVEEAIIERCAGRDEEGRVEVSLNNLLECIEK